MSKPSRQQGGMSLSVDIDCPTDLLLLEPRMLLSADGIDAAVLDDHSDHDHAAGCACTGCCAIEAEFDTESFDLELYEAAESGPADDLFVTATGSTSDTFKLHSKAGARKVIYLDFNGHTTRDTIWNHTYGSTITTPAYDFDGNVNSFSNDELERIQRIWQRVAEDFIPFDVDVTTQDPGVDNLVNDGDGRYGIRVVIGGNSRDWYTGGGGVAYNGTFDAGTDTPTFVFEDNLGNGNEAYTAQAISHEVGHTLGLGHDGDSSTAYYAGHGSGDTGWAPIMGLGYQKAVTQWSRGEYSGASNKQDDLAIITSNNGFGYRADDHGGSTGSASKLGVTGTDVADFGIIERNTDFDVFSFSTGAGTITLDVHVPAFGANLDVKAELLDSGGKVIATSSPSGELGASITKNVSAGDYFLRITGVGNANPSSTGYSDYGSLGQYAITGEIIDDDAAPVVVPSVTINNVSVNESAGTARFTLKLSEPTSRSVSVRAVTSNGSARSGADYDSRTQTIWFSAGQTSKTFTVNITNDKADESNETFWVDLSGPNGLTIADGRGMATIIDNDDPAPEPDPDPAPVENPPSVRINNVRVDEDAGVAKFTLTLSEPARSTATVRASTSSSSASSGDYVARSQTITFEPGQRTQTFAVSIKDDNTDEPDESLLVRLTSPKGLTIADATGVATIIDDDLPLPDVPWLTIADKEVKERDASRRGKPKVTKLKFTVTLSKKASSTVKVNWSTSNRTATAGEDYLAQAGTLKIKKGKLKKTFKVKVLGDRKVEGNEVFRVRLSGAQGAAIRDATANATIIDNDSPAASPQAIALLGVADTLTVERAAPSQSPSVTAAAIRNVLNDDAHGVIDVLRRD